MHIEVGKDVLGYICMYIYILYTHSVNVGNIQPKTYPNTWNLLFYLTFGKMRSHWLPCIGLKKPSTNLPLLGASGISNLRFQKIEGIGETSLESC